MSHSIGTDEVRHVAQLARLGLTNQEAERFGGQLGEIVGYMARLNALPTDGVEPTSHPLPVRNIFRSDEPGPSLPVEQVLRNAPGARPPYFAVPKVLDQEVA